jgi:hypothetical protein
VSGVPEAPSLTVQVVLYHTDLGQVWRQLRGVVHAASRAVGEGTLNEVRLAYGDSSARPNLTDAAFSDLRRVGLDGGLADVSYDFFAANLGSGGGSNKLAGAGNSELFMVLNPDTYPDPRLLVGLVDAIGPADVGAVDARQLPCEHPKAYDPATWDTSWVSGACMVVRRSSFDQVGGFSADLFPMYCDDVDLSWKLRLAGFRTVHVPTALVFHDKKPVTGGVVPAATEQFWASLARLLLCRRWGRPDLEQQTVDWLALHDTGPYQQALEAYRSRAEDGTLPEPLEGADRVAQFVDGNYATHRF